MSYRDPLPVGLELWVVPPGQAGRWLDITADLSDEGVQIGRGRANEAGQSDATTMSCRLRSIDGKYSPRNPRSPLSGLIGRNTPVRFWVEEGAPRLVQWDTADRFEAPAAAGLPATDLDVRFDVRLRDGWWPGEAGNVGAQVPGSWRVALTGDGRLQLVWNTTATTEQTLTSTEPVPGGVTGRKALRVTLDVDNGSGKTVAMFYTAPGLAGPWEAFGAPAQAAGTTALMASVENLSTVCSWPCDVYGLAVLDGIGGTALAAVDFTAGYAVEEWDPTGHWRISVTDTAGAVWDQAGGARLWARRYRFRGEVTTWPQKWTLKGPSTVTAPIECSGILRRLGQGASPVRSAIRRGCESLGPALAGYWPCEDSQNATGIAPAGPYPPGTVVGLADLGTYAGFACSDPILEVGTGRLLFDVPLASATGQVQVRWLAHFPSSDVPVDAVLMRVRLTAGIGWVDVACAASGGLYVRAFTRAGGLLHTTLVVGFDANDRDLRVSLELEQVGADVVARLVDVEAGYSSGLFWEETIAGATLGAVANVEVNPGGVDLGGLGFGHLTVERAISSIFDLAAQLAAYTGERVDSRVLRLAGENGIDVRVVGRGAGVERLGQQERGTMLDLIRDAADSEAGILAEQRDGYGLVLRTLEGLCSQNPPAAAIVYTDNLLVPFEPEDDDQATRNLVTVQRRGGSAATVEDSTSAMGTAAPPAGAGRYDEAVTLSLARDASAVQQAGWLVHLGTVDEARWPQIGLDLAHPVFAGDATSPGDPALVAQVLDLDQGDRFDVSNLPAWLPPYDVQAIVQGYTETITPPDDGERGGGNHPGFHHRIVFNCTPASVYQAGRWVASTYQVETTSTTTTTTVETPVPPMVLVEDAFTGTNGSAWSSTWAAGYTGSGAVTLQSGWGRIAVGTGYTITSRRLASAAPSITGRTTTLVENASTQSITGTLPSDRQTGDVAVVWAVVPGTSTGQLTPPSGWTQMFAPFTVPDANIVGAWYRFDPPSAPVIATSAGASRASVAVQSYGGVDTGTPLDVTPSTAATAPYATSLAAPSITTVTAGCRLVCGGVMDNSSSAWGGTPASMTLIADAAGGGVGRALGLADQTQASAGATGTKTWTGPGGSFGMGVFLAALRPATGAPSPNAGNITFKYRLSGWVFPEFLMRHNTTTLDRQNDYGLRLPTPQDSRLRLYEHTNYSYGTPLGEGQVAVAAGVTVLVRVRVDGSRFRVKAWPQGGTEPDWMIDVTDTTYTAVGYWGFYAGAAGTAGAYVEVDDFRWDDGASGTTTTTETTTTTSSTSTVVPAGPSPWRWDNPNTRLVTDVGGTDTQVQVEVTAGPRWTTDTDDLPVDVLLGGELVTVTAAADITNLAPNPTLAVNATGWAADPGNGTVTAGRQAAGGKHGPSYYRITFEE